MKHLRGGEWQRVDGSMVKTPLAREGTGNNPRDRGKKGTKRSVAVESRGLPIVPDGANRHDSTLWEGTLKALVIAGPNGMNGCLDAGYVGAQELAGGLGYKAPIRGRGEEREEKEHDPSYAVRRRVMEVCHAWMNRFRKLLDGMRSK